MTDINKVRDEVCDNPEFNIGDTKMDALLLHNRKFGWNECVKHLSKQSVAFEPSQSWGEMMSYCKSIGISPASEVYGKLRSAFKEQHQRTALIYEAKLSCLVNAVKNYRKLAPVDGWHFSDCIFLDGEENEDGSISCNCGTAQADTELLKALQQIEGAK